MMLEGFPETRDSLSALCDFRSADYKPQVKKEAAIRRVRAILRELNSFPEFRPFSFRLPWETARQMRMELYMDPSRREELDKQTFGQSALTAEIMDAQFRAHEGAWVWIELNAGAGALGLSLPGVPLPWERTDIKQRDDPRWYQFQLSCKGGVWGVWKEMDGADGVAAHFVELAPPTKV
ncbi:MAG: hypothetical protein ACYCOU_04195 [Sulfobacillus sp.]